MAVYGKGLKYSRKRIKLVSEALIFSSEEEEETDYSGLYQTSDKLVDIVKDSKTTTKVVKDLLPSAEIIRQGKIRQSPRKSIVEESFRNDQLTTSPKKYVSLISSIKSPYRSKTSSIEVSKEKKNVQDEINKLASPISSPIRVSLSPKTTPKEKDAWEDLLNNLQEVEPEDVTIIPLIEEPDFETDIGDKSSFSIDLDSIYNSLDNVTEVSEPKLITKADPLNTIRKTTRIKTYGEERTYLSEITKREEEKDEEKELHKQMQEELIRNYHDFDGYDQEEISNINDLRNLSKSNRIRDEINYLLEGLVFKNSSNLVSDNSLLMTSLIDLGHELFINKSEHIIDHYLIISKRLLRILNKLNQIENDNKNLIEWLISMNIYLFIQILKNDQFKLKSLIQEIKDLKLILAKLNNSYRVDYLSTLTKSNLDKLLKSLPSNEQMQVSLIDHLRAMRCLNDWGTFEMIIRIYDRQINRENKLIILSYFEYYFERKNPIESLDGLSKFFEETIDNIKKSIYDEIDLYMIKLLVILSTNYNDDDEISEIIYEKSRITILLNLINANYQLISLNEFLEINLNITLMSLGYLINFIEHESVLIDSSVLNDNINKLKKLKEDENNEIINHLIGYNIILISYFKLFIDINIHKDYLIQRLKNFEIQIKNMGIHEKIKNLINQLNNLV